MKKFTILLAVLMLSSYALAGIIVNEGCTYQSWETDPTGDFTLALDYNPYGDPELEYDDSGISENTMIFTIPNNPVANEYKNIALTIFIDSDPALNDVFKSIALIATHLDTTTDDIQYSYIEVEQIIPDQEYVVTIKWHIEPNPISEKIMLGLNKNINVSEIQIKTCCVPEPATIGLLVVGSLITFRRR